MISDNENTETLHINSDNVCLTYKKKNFHEIKQDLAETYSAVLTY